MLCFARYCRDTIQVRWETFTSHCGKFNQESITKVYQNQPRFVKDMTKTFWGVFLVRSFNCCLLAKCECKVSQVVQRLYLGGKHLHFCMTNLLQMIHAKFYQNQSGFVEEMTKNILVFFSLHNVYSRIYYSTTVIITLNFCDVMAV